MVGGRVQRWVAEVMVGGRVHGWQRTSQCGHLQCYAAKSNKARGSGHLKGMPLDWTLPGLKVDDRIHGPDAARPKGG
jgi:hypothetical protein